MKFGNCLFYALRIWRWRPSHHLVIRKSRWGHFPHFAVLIEQPDGTLVKQEYAPVKPRPRWLPPFLFRGAVRITRYRKVVDHES